MKIAVADTFIEEFQCYSQHALNINGLNTSKRSNGVSSNRTPNENLCNRTTISTSKPHVRKSIRRLSNILGGVCRKRAKSSIVKAIVLCFSKSISLKVIYIFRRL
jgi:hypothetical protein